MRIVITMLHYYPDNPGGSARLAYDEAMFLANLGHEVWVVTQDIERNKPYYSFKNSLHVLRYPSPKLDLFDPRRMWTHQRQTRALLSRFIRHPVDLVHGHSLLNYDGAVGLYGENTRKCYSVHSPIRLEMLASGRGAPLFKRLHFSMVGNLNHYIEKRCIKRSDVVTVFSDYTRSLLYSSYSKRILQKTRIIPGWVDLSKFRIVSNRQAKKSQLGWPLDVPVLFSLRRLVPRMGLDRLLYALNTVKSAGWAFYLVLGGSGPLRSHLEVLTNELGLIDMVHFAGNVPEDVLPQMYAAADAFILPTAELECFGIIALEALSCGRPVLATPVGAIPEILGRIEPRWLAHNQSRDAIAQLIISFLSGELPSHDPENLRQVVAQKYSTENALKKLVSVVTGESL